MFPYLLLMGLAPVLGIALNPKKTKRRRFWFIVLFFGAAALIAAFRDVSVGADTLQFCTWYGIIGSLPVEDIATTRYEIGFVVFCKALYSLSPNYQLLLCVSSVVIFSSIAAIVYRYSEDVVFSAFLLVSLALYTSYLNIMRQALAMAFILFGIMRLLNNRKFSFIVFVLIAVLFHKSAILALVFLPLMNIKFSRRVVVSYIAISLICYLFAVQITDAAAIVLSKDEFYRAKYMQANYYGALIRVAFYSVIALICANYFTLSTRMSEASSDQNLVMHAVMLWLLFTVMGARIEILGRFSVYFGVFALIAIPNALSLPEIANEERKMVTTVMVVLTISYFVVIGVFRPEWQGAIPYVFAGDNFLAMLNSIF